MEETQIRSLVQLAQSGDREAFGQLVTAFEPIVYRVVLRRLRDASDAREVTQEVFLRAMRKIGQLREPERFAGWLRQIAVRMSISNIVRRPGVATVSVQTFDAFQSDPTTPVDTLLKTEEAEQVWAGLKQLKQLDRETLIAFYINGNSLAEMSGSFRRPIGTIKRRLHTARHRLRATLGNLGGLHPV
jgi:RNA polymerase sigma-70 factor (ECF subfamily)